jgi:hypothetical protein
MVAQIQAKRGQKTVKAFDNDIALINEEAKRLGCTAAEVIRAMCAELRRQTYLREVGESFDLAQADSVQFDAFQAEHKLWDGTLSDGLDDAT